MKRGNELEIKIGYVNDELLNFTFDGEIDEDGDLLVKVEGNKWYPYRYFNLEQVKKLHKHLGLVIDKYENDGVTIYDRVESQLAVEEAKGGYIGTKISSSEIARVIDTYKKLGGV